MQIDQKKLALQYQNKVNNAQGHSFEGYIKAGRVFYDQRGLATVDKTPEPFRVLKKLGNGIFNGRFTARAQPDFQGTLAGGRSIVFEAKYTTTDRMTRETVTDEQQKALAQHAERGALSAVCVGIRNDFFFVPWEVWRDMKKLIGRKYVTAADLEAFRVRFNGAVLFLDFTHEAGRRWIHGNPNTKEWRFGGNGTEQEADAEIDGPGHTADGV